MPPHFAQVEALFEEIRSSAQPVHVTVQYVEIYNEVVKDLLDPAPKLTNLDVREDPRQGTFVAGAATLEVMPLAPTSVRTGRTGWRS